MIEYVCMCCDSLLRLDVAVIAIRLVPPRPSRCAAAPSTAASSSAVLRFCCFVVASLFAPLLLSRLLRCRLSDIFDFTLRFDALRMERPFLPNDFSYYRRLLPKFNKHPGVKIKDDEASGMALFTAEHIPMMTTLARACNMWSERQRTEETGDAEAREMGSLHRPTREPALDRGFDEASSLSNGSRSRLPLFSPLLSLASLQGRQRCAQPTRHGCARSHGELMYEDDQEQEVRLAQRKPGFLAQMRNEG